MKVGGTETITRETATAHGGLKLNEIDAFISKTKTAFPWALEGVSERTSKQMSATERASEANSAELVNEWAEWANEPADERVPQYSLRRFHSHSTQCTASEFVPAESLCPRVMLVLNKDLSTWSFLFMSDSATHIPLRRSVTFEFVTALPNRSWRRFHSPRGILLSLLLLYGPIGNITDSLCSYSTYMHESAKREFQALRSLVGPLTFFTSLEGN